MNDASKEETPASIVDANDARLRAAAARDAGNLDVALRWSDRSLELARKQGRAAMKRVLSTRSSIFRRLDRPDDALAAARECVAVDGSYEDNGPGYCTLVASLVDKGEYGESVELASCFLEGDRDNAYAQNAAGRAFYEASEGTGEVVLLNRAELCFRRVTELDPVGSTALEELRRIHSSHVRAGRAMHAARLAAFLEGLDGPIAGTG